MKGDLWVVSTYKKYRRRRVTLVVCIVLPIICYAAFVFSSHMKSYNTLKVQRISAEQKLGQAEQENEQLKQEVKYTKTDEFIVQKARELLGYVKPGEVKFVDDGN